MSSPSVDDFIMVSQIGKGTYAKVILVRSKADNKLYALKMLKKKWKNNDADYNYISEQFRSIRQVLALLTRI